MRNVGVNDLWPIKHNRAVRKRPSEAKDDEVSGPGRPGNLNAEFRELVEIQLFRAMQVPLHGVLRRQVIERQESAFLKYGQWEHGAIRACSFDSTMMVVWRPKPLFGRANNSLALFGRKWHAFSPSSLATNFSDQKRRYRAERAKAGLKRFFIAAVK